LSQHNHNLLSFELYSRPPQTTIKFIASSFNHDGLQDYDERDASINAFLERNCPTNRGECRFGSVGIRAVFFLFSNYLAPQVFETRALMTMEWKSVEVETLSTEQIFHFEQSSSQYFRELLTDPTHSALQGSTSVLSTNVNTRSQERKDNGLVIVESIFQLFHSGEDGLADLAGLLMFVTSRNTTNSSFSELDTLLGMDIKVGIISFTNEQDSALLSTVDKVTDRGIRDRSDSEKTLITASAILAFTLLAMSVILIWVAGGWLALRKQVKILIHREEEFTRMTKQHEQDLKEAPTGSQEYDEGSDNDDATNMTDPTGILGGQPNYKNRANNMLSLQGLGIRMTPTRQGHDDDSLCDVETPMSACTAFTETSRAPLGITSMRKLLPQLDGKGANSLDNFRAERLAY
jgi:hypothetical protein